MNYYQKYKATYSNSLSGGIDEIDEIDEIYEIYEIDDDKYHY